MQIRNERASSKLATALAKFDLTQAEDAINDGESFFSFPLDNHPFLKLSAKQQVAYFKEHVNFFLASTLVNEILDFYQWLDDIIPGTDKKIFSLTQLNLTQDHLNAYLGYDFDVKSVVQDAAGFIPLFGYILSGNLIHPNRAVIRNQVILSETLLANLPHQASYEELFNLFLIAGDKEKTTDLFTKPLIRHQNFVESIPFWLGAIIEGEIQFVKNMVAKRSRYIK